MKKLNTNTLKFIAVAAMLIDHCAILFVPSGTPLSTVMRIIGRLSAPIMCFFIAEGYFHTSNLKKYMLRLFAMVLISHLPYTLCFGYKMWDVLNHTSVIWNLFLGLCALSIYKSEKLNSVYKLLGIILCCIASVPSSWDYTAVLWILFFGIFRDDKRSKWLLFLAVAALNVITSLTAGAVYSAIISSFVILAIPLLLIYNGRLGKKSKVIQWSFYLFYPIHLAALALINMFI